MSGQYDISPSEAQEQSSLFKWARNSVGRYPELCMMFHIPNGGKRGGREAAAFKRMGVKPGVPDIFLPVPKGGYHGLWVEMKARKGRVSDDQKDYMTKLSRLGYACCVCFGCDDAIDAIEKYLSLDKKI